MSTAGPQIMSFRSMSLHYNIHEMPQECNSFLYQVAYGKTGFMIVILLKVTEPINDVK